MPEGIPRKKRGADLRLIAIPTIKAESVSSRMSQLIISCSPTKLTESNMVATESVLKFEYKKAGGVLNVMLRTPEFGKTWEIFWRINLWVLFQDY